MYTVVYLDNVSCQLEEWEEQLTSHRCTSRCGVVGVTLGGTPFSASPQRSVFSTSQTLSSNFRNLSIGEIARG